jgi:AraC-like DNA-binding protein
MPSSIVRHFIDPDAYLAAASESVVELTLTNRGEFAAKFIRIDLHRVWMQRLSDSLPRIAHAANMSGRVTVNFGTGSEPGPLSDGVELRSDTIVRHGDGHRFFQRSNGPTSFCSMSLPVEDMAGIGAAILGFEMKAASDALILKPLPHTIARLQRLHAAAATLAEEAPEIITHPQAARGLEQEMIEAVVDCLATGARRADTAASRRHKLVMKRFRDMMEAHRDDGLHIFEVCTELRVSERTLRDCCQEFLGMSPHRYLWLRRMHLARRALQRPDQSSAAVTKVATDNGFWELGRFSVGYRQLFGESPSTTLQRARATDPRSWTKSNLPFADGSRPA